MVISRLNIDCVIEFCFQSIQLVVVFIALLQIQNQESIVEVYFLSKSVRDLQVFLIESLDQSVSGKLFLKNFSLSVSGDSEVSLCAIA